MATNSNNASSNTATSAPQTRAVSSPWTQIVRGESEPIAAVPSSPSSSPTVAIDQPAAVLSTAEEESAENGSGPNGNAGKKPAWNKPSNGAAEVGPVMGAHSWPALSESARVSTKSSSDSPKVLSDGSSPSSSVSVSQGTGTTTSSQKQVTNNANSNSTPNHTVSSHQRSTKRNGASSSSNGGLSQPTPAGVVVEAPLNSPSSRDHTQRSGFGSQSHSGNDHPPQRNSYRNRNGGPHSRGDGSHSQSYGSRRNQDHGHQDWNAHRNFNGRDAHMQPQRVVPRFMRHPPPPPPPNSAPFIVPQPVRPPFGAPVGFPELPPPVYYVAAPPPESLRGVPLVAPMPSVFFPAPDLQLHARIVTQIDYYFSNENLIKDTFLRQNMDEQGWVPIKLIAGFKKVLLLTDNIQLILEALRSSTVVEVQGDKVRKRGDWKRWIMPPSVQFPNVSSPQSSQDMLAASVQNISLDQNATNRSGGRSQEENDAEALLGRSSSGDLTNQSQVSISDGTGVSPQGGVARNLN